MLPRFLVRTGRTATTKAPKKLPPAPKKLDVGTVVPKKPKLPPVKIEPSRVQTETLRTKAMRRSKPERRRVFDRFNTEFHQARSEPTRAIKALMISKAMRELNGQMKSRPMPSAVGMDLLTKLSYVQLPVETTSFPLTIGQDPVSMLPTGSVQCQLVEDFRQTLSLADLAKLPRSVLPGTGFQVWHLASEDGGTKKGLVFTGTNSVGPNRDGTLGREHSTGALANTTKGGVGFGVIPHWLDLPGNPLSKHLPDVTFIAGHSLGAALAQEAMLARLEMSGTPPRGWFASASCLSRPCSEQWVQNAMQMFFVGSSQDPVRQAGTWKYPGLELIASPLDLPVSSGIGNSMLDGLITQHGAEIPTLLWSRGDELNFSERLQTSVGEPFDGGLPIDQLMVELADLGRPLVASKMFTGTSVENVMAALEKYGLDEPLYEKGSTVRGPAYAYGVHLTHELLASELVSACYVAAPYETLQAIGSCGREFLSKPETAMEKLVNRLPLDEVQIMVENDTKSVLPSIAKLNQQMRELF